MLAIRFVVLYRSIQNISLHIICKTLFRKTSKKNINNICIYRVGNIGDIICSIPAIQIIRKEYQGAKIILLTSSGGHDLPGAKEILQGADFIDEMLIYDPVDIRSIRGIYQLINQLKAKKIDLWIDLPSEIASFWRQAREIIFARLTGAKMAFGWRIDSIKFFRRTQAKKIIFKTEVERLIEIVGQNIQQIPREVQFNIPIKNSDKFSLNKIMNEKGVSDLTNIVAIAPGAKRATNRWRDQSFIQVGKYLSSMGFQILILGGKSDINLCQKIKIGIGENAVNFAGELSLVESCALLGLSQFLIAVDSGVQHMASSMGTRVITISSSRDFPGKWAPWGVGNKVFRRDDLECICCLLDKCPKENKCINSIDHTEIISAIDNFIQK